MTFINNKLPINNNELFNISEKDFDTNPLVNIVNEAISNDIFNDIPDPIATHEILNLSNPQDLKLYLFDIDQTDVSEESEEVIPNEIIEYIGQWSTSEDFLSNVFQEISFDKKEEKEFFIVDLEIPSFEKTQNAYDLASIGKKLFVQDEFGKMQSVLTAKLKNFTRSSNLYFLEDDKFIELTEQKKEIASKLLLKLISIRIYKPKFIIEFIKDLYRQEKKDLKEMQQNNTSDRPERSMMANTTREIKTFFVETLRKTVVKALIFVTFTVSQKAIEQLRINEHRKQEREREERNREYDHKIEKRKDFETRADYSKQHERLLDKDRSIKRSNLHSARKV